jgi:hypothetical protein
VIGKKRVESEATKKEKEREEEKQERELDSIRGGEAGERT